MIRQLNMISTILMISFLVQTNEIVQISFSQDDNLKTFYSPEYRFSIEYPSYYEVQNYLESESPFVNFFSGWTDGISDPMLSIKTTNTAILDYVNSKISSELEDDVNTLFQKITPITIDGNEGYSFSIADDVDYRTASMIEKYTIFTHGGNIYQFYVVGGSDDFDERTFNQMIKSIKFMN